MIEWMYRWQTLLGAAIGGLFAVIVALLVAYKARRREEDAAAMMLVAELMPFSTATEAQREAADLQQTPPEEQLLGMADQFIRRRPQLSSLFDGEMARVLRVDGTLTTHLVLFRESVRLAEQGFSRLEAAETRIRSGGESGYSDEDLRYEMESTARRMKDAGEQAKRAIGLLTKLFVGWKAPFRRFWRSWVGIPESEKNYLESLQERQRAQIQEAVREL